MKTYLVKCLGAKGFDKVVQGHGYVINSDTGVLRIFRSLGEGDGEKTVLSVKRWVFIEEVNSSAGSPVQVDSVEGFLADNSHLTELDEQGELDS